MVITQEQLIKIALEHPEQPVRVVRVLSITGTAAEVAYCLEHSAVRAGYPTKLSPGKGVGQQAEIARHIVVTEP